MATFATAVKVTHVYLLGTNRNDDDQSKKVKIFTRGVTERGNSYNTGNCFE